MFSDFSYISTCELYFLRNAVCSHVKRLLFLHYSIENRPAERRQDIKLCNRDFLPLNLFSIINSILNEYVIREDIFKNFKKAIK